MQRNTFIACFLGWSLDAFDFFILIFCVSAIATEFHAQVSAIFEAIFLTLAMRPVGAFLFGTIADRFGRRPALMIDIVAFSVFELASAFAPSLHIFLIMRALFGIAMGGEWGVGAALAFETLPTENRGFFSGAAAGRLRSGLPAGGAAVRHVISLHRLAWNVCGRRAAGISGDLHSHESGRIAGVAAGPRSCRRSAAKPGKDIVKYLGTFIFLMVLMFAFNSYSHGTQDVYPTFLQKNRGFSPATVGLVAIVYNLGALLGGICFGSWSERHRPAEARS